MRGLRRIAGPRRGSSAPAVLLLALPAALLSPPGPADPAPAAADPGPAPAAVRHYGVPVFDRVPELPGRLPGPPLERPGGPGAPPGFLPPRPAPVYPLPPSPGPYEGAWRPEAPAWSRPWPDLRGRLPAGPVQHEPWAVPTGPSPGPVQVPAQAPEAFHAGPTGRVREDAAQPAPEPAEPPSREPVLNRHPVDPLAPPEGRARSLSDPEGANGAGWFPWPVSPRDAGPQRADGFEPWLPGPAPAGPGLAEPLHGAPGLTDRVPEEPGFEGPAGPLPGGATQPDGAGAPVLPPTLE